MVERTPFDGLPYYCANCGLGYGEWIACDADCPLETAADAEARATAQAPVGGDHG